MEEERQSIYRVARTIKKKENSLYNALRSIYEDSIFVGEISLLWPELPLLANLRCGLWYSSNFHYTCYFKSTDGHNNNWSFNTSRLNLHTALLAGNISRIEFFLHQFLPLRSLYFYSLGQKGGCMIVDSTRKGKRFPDSMSKTIPIWTCVLNRAIMNYRKKFGRSENWDCTLHLPLWISKTEKASIEDRLERWTEQLEASGADIASLASSLQKPLRPLWISQRTVIWLNEVPDYDSWDFTPIILVSASSPNSNFQHKTNSEFSWTYIAGAGDDEESWSRGLSPKLFWNHVYDLINSGPELCNQKVADIVEKDRVYRAQRGHNAPQVFVKSLKSSRSNAYISMEEEAPLVMENNLNSSDETHTIYWLASTNIAVGSYKPAANGADYDCTLICDRKLVHDSFENSDSHLCLPVVNSKMDRFSLSTHLETAVNFAKLNLRKRKKLLVCCSNGEDISICVSLAILTSLFTDEGEFDDGESFSKKCITKDEMRKRLVFICKYAVNARPSRGNLRQVFNYLMSKHGRPYP